MRTKIAEWAGILSFLYLVGDFIWKFQKEFNMSLLFEIVMFSIVVGSFVIVFREKYKELIQKRFDGITKMLDENSKSLDQLKEWVMFQEYDDNTKYSSLDHKIKVFVGMKGI